MEKLLETERLYFRYFTADDARLLYEMHQDPEITRHTGDPVPWDSLELASRVLEEVIIPQYQKKIGRWAVHLRSDDSFIGWCGLKDVGKEVDLGYRYIQKYWRNGYATEAAVAMLDYGKQLRLQNIVGRASVHNPASISVLKKIGLTFKEFYVDEDTKVESVRYVLV